MREEKWKYSDEQNLMMCTPGVVAVPADVSTNPQVIISEK